MVKHSKLELDESLYEDEKRWDKLPRLPRGRTDNALAVVLVLCVALVALLVLTYKKENWWAVALIGLLFLASELFALPMRGGGRLSLAFLPVVVAMMVSGPAGAAVVTLFGVPIFYLERGQQGFRRVLFNAAQMFLAAGLAGWVYSHIGGIVIDAAMKDTGKAVIPWILAVLLFFVLNTVLVTFVLTPEGERLVRYWNRRLMPRFFGYLLYGGIGFLAAVVYVKLEYPAMVLLFAPLVAVRVMYTRYGTMRNVCDDATLAVMEAVERGGMFMQGHSVGVADMAVAIGEEMDLNEEDVHFLRQAALLHDVGRLALDPAVTDKPGLLTSEEYEEIKKHPLVAAEILAKEPSFSVVAPAVRHHHEMADGSGYVDGLAGETIPIGARILAVADAFDAMQRPAPYREQMSPNDSASEVVKAKGIQFDPEVVDAFTKVVVKRGLWKGALQDKIKMPARRASDLKDTGESARPTLQESVETVESARSSDGRSGATPAEGIKYTEVRGEIEKDIREWERSDIVRSRRRTRGEPRRRPGGRKRKGQEAEPPRDAEDT
jgi:putative nucleotidyltransferase with HDIG domain